MERAFKRDVRSLDAIFDFLDSCGSAHHLDGSALFTVKFAIEEIFTNMVKYNPRGPENISILVNVDAGSLTLRLIDFEETPFDVTKKEGPDLELPIEQRMPGGLGIHLVKNMVDKVDYEHVDNKSTVTLTMNLG